MKKGNIFWAVLASALSLAVSCSEEMDMSSYDEWLGEKFNQEVLWNPDSLAFRRADWASRDIVGGVQIRTSSVKMLESVQSISFITYSPNMFNTYIGSTGEAGTVGEIAGNYEDALFAINGTDIADAYLKIDGNVLNGSASQPGAEGAVGLISNPISIEMQVGAADAGVLDGYDSAMAAGPVLLVAGVEQEFPAGDFYDTRMARSVIGVTDAGNYVFGVIDGGVAGTADGATVKEAAFIARLMGLQDAVLLGSGDAVSLWSAEDGVLNSPSGDGTGRTSAVVYVGAGSAKLSGEGTADSPYLIENHIHLTQMRALSPAGSTTYFRMEEDVDMSSVKSWTPVNYDGEYNRQIHFDGNGKTIANFAPAAFVDDADATKAANYPSLFGVLYGSCRNLTIIDSKIEVSDGTASCGFLGGYVGTTGKPAEIENVHISGEVIGGSCLGGFGGQSREATYRNCSSDVKITSGGTDVGGFVGKSAVSILFENCTAKVYISASKNPGNNMRYGALMGWASGGTLTVTDCSASGTIYNDSFSCNCASGLVAYAGAETVISRCHTAVDILCERTSADGSGGKLSNSGGICGTVSTASTCTIENCFSEGKFNPWQCSGGIVGRHEKGTLTVSDSYSAYEILGYSGLGGICGQSASGQTLVLNRCFAWNPSITAYRNAADKYSSGAVVGSASGTSTFSGCFRRADLEFSDPYRILGTHSDLSGAVQEGDANQQAYDAAPTAEKTLSAAAKKAGWDASVWDFSGDEPVLR